MKRTINVVLACGVAASFAASPGALGQGLAVKEIVTDHGVFTVPVDRPDNSPNPGWPAPRSGWFYDTGVAIGSSVALSADHTWGALSLNDESLVLFDTDGDGTPLYEVFSGDGSPAGAAASADGDRVAYLDDVPLDGRLRVSVFDASSSTPVWEHVFDANYTIANRRNVAMSRDGSVVAAMVRDSGAGETIARFFDAQTGAVLSTFAATQSGAALDLTDDGSLAMVSLGNQPRVVETATGNLVWAGTGTGAGNVEYRISGDGEVLVVGGFSMHIYEWNGSTYSQIISFSTPPTEWFGRGAAVSRDGSTVASMSRESQTNRLNIRIWDVASRQMIAESTLAPVPDTRQTAPQRARATDDGSLFAFGHWGDGTGVYEEIMVFDRDADIVAAIDMPGSAFDVDMAPDGSWVAGTGKAVHANVFGNGGQIVTKQLAAPCPPDWNGDGVVDSDDLFDFLADWAAGNADYNGDGVTDSDDLFDFLADWADPGQFPGC